MHTHMYSLAPYIKSFDVKNGRLYYDSGSHMIVKQWHSNYFKGIMTC